MTKLSILIATLGERKDRFTALVDKLVSQANDDVEIIAYFNNGELPLGDIRQALVDEAVGQYVCFIDDDDGVPDYYVEMILDATKKKPDYVGWQMQLYHDDVKAKPTYHSLRYDRWSEDENGYYRDISHLNPIRRDIAKKVSFKTEKGVAEDVPWAQKIRSFVGNEVYIDKPMYFYYHRTYDSRWRGEGIEHLDYDRPVINSKHFRYVEDK